MDWWRWVAAAVEAILLVVLVLLWFDTLRDRPGWSTARAVRSTGYAVVIIPLGVAAVLLVPAWLVLLLVAVPALAILAMALAT